MEYSQICEDWTTHFWITNGCKSNKKGNKRNTLKEMKIKIHAHKKNPSGMWQKTSKSKVYSDKCLC